jgi:serine protease
MVLVLAACLAVSIAFGVSAAAADVGPIQTAPKHFFWAQGQTIDPQATADSTTNDLLWHGGNAGAGAIGVETTPAVYLVFWGPQWASGFQTADTNGQLYSSKTLQNYVTSFFANVGGSSWANIQTQYCNVVLPGSTSCVGGAGFITNPTHQLKGVWTDPAPVPDDIVTLGLAENLADDPIAQEAIRASAHFGYDSTATYIILTPPSTIATGEPVYCGYHTQTSSVDGLGNPYRIQYAFGNGIFDGYSIVTGHEYSEAVTDPDNIASWQDGWLDASGNENGDKCAWASNSANIALGSHSYAVQPLWSNEAYDATGNGCVLGR